MRQSNIIRFIFVILLFTMNSQIITYSREANNNTLNISNKITLTPNLNLNINETSNSKLFSIFINTNTILQTQYTYITLETIGQ